MKKKEYNIAKRHILSFLLLIALPVLVGVFLIGYVFRKEIVKTAREQREATLQKNADSIDAELQRMSLIASSLIHNRTLMNRTLEYIHTESPEQRYVLSFAFEDIFNTYFLLSKQLGAFCLFFDDGSMPFVSRNYAGINYLPEDFSLYTELAKNHPGYVIFSDQLVLGGGRSGGQPMVSLVVSPPVRTRYATGIQTLVVSFIVNELAGFTGQELNINSRFSPDISRTFLVGRDGQVLLSNDSSAMDQPFAEVRRNLGKSSIIMERPVTASGWTIVEAIDTRVLTQPVNQMMSFVYIAMGLLVFLFIRYNTLFFGTILRPLNGITAKMEVVARGDFSVRAEFCDFAELNKVSHTFNFMVEEINTLTEEIKSEQKERLKTEIEVLRYQLNPHFLCNTLNAIRMMAVITKNDAIQKMTTALMTITEDTLARDDTICSLEHELRNLESYVYIMKVRYGETFDFIMDIDSSLLHLGMPAMILQPLVENAILHGLAGLTRPGTIVVSASSGGDSLTLEVRDDGQGIPEDALAGLFQEPVPIKKGFTKIGLSGVRKRINLLYGSRYDVTILSYPGAGTVVTLTLPIMDAPEHESRIPREKLGVPENDGYPDC